MLDSAPLRFALLVAGAALFVWLTSLWLPDVVASHFEGDGYANGFMSRAVYLRFTLAFVIGLPAVVVGVSHVALRSPNARINLPNRDYWLAPERRAQTVAFLRSYMMRFGTVLVAFLCYVHWLVIRANRLTPPRLSTPGMVGGLVAFVVFALIWTRMLLRRFRKLP